MAAAGIIPNHMAAGPDDRRAYIVIVAVVGLVWSLLVLCIRVFIRLRLSGPFGADDAAASLATIIAVCQTATVLYAVRQGVGVRDNPAYHDSVDSGLKAYYASTIMYIMALCPAKASMSLLISRVSRQAADKHLLATRIATSIIVLWGVASVFIVAFQCGSTQPWDLAAPGHCTGLFPRWLAIEALSLVLELLIASLAFSLVLGLDLALQTKLIVILAFSAQLLVAIPVAYRLVLLRDATTTTHRGPVLFILADTTIVTQVVMHFSVIAATFPCFRQFLHAFSNDFGATTKMGTDEDRSVDRSHGQRSNSNSYAMSVLREHYRGSIQTTRPQDVESEIEVEDGVLLPRAPPRDRVLTPVDDGRSLQSIGSDRAIMQNKQKRAR
ncbi:hypothetical protein CCM_02170 [Cordyceps militaris CM01]|uniref:Rhodopsin domain-containing protein n=1 Tax=Cordyceps militaris (strain CM01) TaxID=983644 RepID=G3J858_CORMM|nr:uncharacterized protein CCM_02170 [Cordyceps militaris CM01]EGX93900.1 hypothetical protein CCM_02170 [Cordyceps militaris CM01]